MDRTTSIYRPRTPTEETNSQTTTTSPFLGKEARDDQADGADESINQGKVSKFLRRLVLRVKTSVMENVQVNDGGCNRTSVSPPPSSSQLQQPPDYELRLVNEIMHMWGSTSNSGVHHRLFCP